MGFFWKFRTIRIQTLDKVSLIFESNYHLQKKLSIETLVEQIKPIVMEKFEFEK